jgi:cell wall-associated NlpC family hydrolase
MQAQVQSVIQEALSYKGTKYKWGGNDRQGIDCSGLMVRAFAAASFNIPRIAGDQTKIGLHVEMDELVPGDLVFFTDQPGNVRITHVGLVIGTNYPQRSVTFVHASSGQYGVMESELLSKYWMGVYLQATRPTVFLGNPPS